MKVVQSTQIVIEDIIQPCDYEGYYPPTELLRKVPHNQHPKRIGFTKIIADDKVVFYEDFGVILKLYDTQNYD